MPRIKVGLYHVAVKNDPARTVREVLTAVGAMPNDVSRARTISENEPVRPRSLNLQEDHCSGVFTRIRILRQLALSNAAGREDTLRFQPGDPTPCDHTPFLFDYRSNVLHIDEHAGGVTHAAFARYIQSVGELQSVQASVIISQEDLIRFQRQQTFSKITVSLAGMDNAEYLRNLGFDQRQIMALTHFLGSPKLKLEASITSRKREPEGLNRIKETVAALLTLGPKQLKKLVVEGREDEETQDFPVDLIKGRIRYEVDVNLNQEGEIADADRHAAVREAWIRNRDALRQRFRPEANQQG